MSGSEEVYGISTTVEDNNVEDDLIIDIGDSSPGEDDKIEEELNKEKEAAKSTPFGSPSSLFSTPTVPQAPTTTGLPFGSPSANQPSSGSSWNWNSGSLGINSQQSSPYSYNQQSSIWGSNNNGSNYNWGSNNNAWSWGNNNNSFNAFNNSPSNSWNWGNNNTQRSNIQTIDKKIVFCSFIDTIVCSFNSFSNGRLTYINRVPSDLTDMYVRKEVLFKMSKITADVLLILVPSELIRSMVSCTSLNQKRPDDIERDIKGVTDYLRMCVMTFMKHTISDARYCQFLMTPNTDWRYLADLVSGEINSINQCTNNQYSLDKIMFLGANGGLNGYGSNDKMIAESCKIDFLDTNVLLNS